MRGFHKIARRRLMWLVLTGALLLPFAGWKAWGALRLEPPPADFAARHVAQMQAQMENIHRGKVDAATLSRIAAMNMAAPDPVPIAAGFIAIGDTGTDRSEIAQYLADAKTAPSPKSKPPVVTAQLATPGPVARPAADDRFYVGQKTCIGCHQQEAANWAHTIHAKVFTLNPRDEMETKGCEACHGPGSAHVKAPADLSTIISFSGKSRTEIPKQNAQCLACHQGGQRIFWHGSIHENNKLGCSDCHNPMANLSARGLTARESVNQTCFSCHKTQRVQFGQRSHMPLLEGKISCVDCHNPHGSTTQPLLKADSINETCYGCHAEKRGPFLFEHAPVRENCVNCHSPHGSNFEALLTMPRPMLCQSCHAQNGHPAQLMTMGNLANGPRPDPRLIAGSCQTCHVNIHGSNMPSGSRFER